MVGRMYIVACEQISIQEIQVSDTVSFVVSSLLHTTVSKYSEAVGHLLVTKKQFRPFQ